MCFCMRKVFLDASVLQQSLRSRLNILEYAKTKKTIVKTPKKGRNGSKNANIPIEVDPRNSAARGPIQQSDAKKAAPIVEKIVLFILIPYSLFENMFK